MRTLRDHPGSGRDPLLPVPAAVQREALDALARGVLGADSFRLSPALQRKLAPDFNERGEALFGWRRPGEHRLLDHRHRARHAARAAGATDERRRRRAPARQRRQGRRGAGGKPGDSFRLSELYARLTREVWSELGTAGDISAPRRELQREHLNRLAAMLLRPQRRGRAPTRKSLLRVQARELLARINSGARAAAA